MTRFIALAIALVSITACVSTPTYEAYEIDAPCWSPELGYHDLPCQPPLGEHFA